MIQNPLPNLVGTKRDAFRVGLGIFLALRVLLGRRWQEDAAETTTNKKFPLQEGRAIRSCVRRRRRDRHPLSSLGGSPPGVGCGQSRRRFRSEAATAQHRGGWCCDEKLKTSLFGEIRNYKSHGVLCVVSKFRDFLVKGGRIFF